MSESSLNKSRNFFTAKGWLSEKCSIVKNKGRVPMAIEHNVPFDIYENGEKTGEKGVCDRLFGIITLETQDGTCDFQINARSKNFDGTDNKRWEMFRTIAEDWNPKIGGHGDPDFVTVSGSVAIYDSVGKDGKVYPKLQWSATSKCDRIAADWENSGCTLSASCYVKAVNPEVVKEEETGRYKVNAYAADNRGQVFPVDFFVDGDEAVDFITEEVSIGDTLNFDVNRIIKTIGGKSSASKKTFGSSRVNTGSSFTLDELVLTAGEVIEEPDELVTEDEDGNEVPVKTMWMNPTAVKKAIKEREKMLDELKNGGGEKKSTSGKSIKERAKAKEKAKPTMKKPSHPVEDEDDDETPFDEDDDF